ncbi:MAG: FAD-binding protein [Clostridia bacterium]|nr:FAD-binding protein [Clostridia bacterium]
MNIVVCVRQGLDGELGPFDASAYEAALRMEGAEITLLSMGPASVGEFLQRLTRLGAKKAILLSDPIFAGADTLATAYTLSKAIQKIKPELILCGRQTLIGDTAQTGAMLSALLDCSLMTNVMSIDSIENGSISCTTRDEGTANVPFPALLTVERTYSLRLPRLRSKAGELEIWNSKDVGADPEQSGLKGSPTRVIKTFENQSGKRKCQWISMEDLDHVIRESLKKSQPTTKKPTEQSKELLSDLCIVGKAPRSFAETVAENIIELPLTDADEIIQRIKEIHPSAVLWGSDATSKRLAAIVAAKMKLGLCADCTLLECEAGELMMYRPALSGSVIAKIKSLTRPAMATVRTKKETACDIIVTAGFGVKDQMNDLTQFAEDLGAMLCASRKLVDHGYAPYEAQVGLTGKTVSPPIYIAIGVSGAVHHIAGMQRAGTVIAINPDRNAPIFEYADYGIIDHFKRI